MEPFVIAPTFLQVDDNDVLFPATPFGFQETATAEPNLFLLFLLPIGGPILLLFLLFSLLLNLL